jgi:hypothetical protein
MSLTSIRVDLLVEKIFIASTRTGNYSSIGTPHCHPYVACSSTSIQVVCADTVTLTRATQANDDVSTWAQ